MICDKSAPETQKQTIQRKDILRYNSLFWLFMLGSVLGFIVEGIWCIFRYGEWQSHSALIWGPFCIIYGVGAVAIYLTVPFLQSKGLLAQFMIYCMIGAAIEFFSSLFQKTCFGSVSWNYSKHFFEYWRSSQFQNGFGVGCSWHSLYSIYLSVRRSAAALRVQQQNLYDSMRIINSLHACKRPCFLLRPASLARAPRQDTRQKSH